MIVCHCHVVTDRAVAAPSTTARASLAGGLPVHRRRPDCGACVFSVKRLVCEHGAPSATCPEVDVAAS